MTRLYQLTLTGPEAVMLAGLMPIASETMGVGVKETAHDRAESAAEFCYRLFLAISVDPASWEHLNRKLDALNKSVVLEVSSDA